MLDEYKMQLALYTVVLIRTKRRRENVLEFHIGEVLPPAILQQLLDG